MSKRVAQQLKVGKTYIKYLERGKPRKDKKEFNNYDTE